jgi:hypothetical protein
LPADQIDRQFWQSLVVTFRPTVFDRDVATLDKTRLIEALLKGGHDQSSLDRRQTAEEAGNRHGGWLAARHERPCCRSAAHHRDEIPSPH